MLLAEPGAITMKRIVCQCLLLGSIASAAVTSTAEELELRYQGIPHDALYDICFRGQSGMAVGDHGLMLSTRDAGVTWEADSRGEFKGALLGISCSGNKPVVVGQQGAIYVYDNGAWLNPDPLTEERLFSVALSDKGVGVAVGAFGTVLRTTDGAATWEKLTIDWEKILNDYLEPHIYDVSINNQGLITIVGEFELIMQSADSGETWTVRHQGDASLFGVHLLDTGEGFAVGQEGRILKTEDGGASWIGLDSGVSSILLDVWASYQGEVLVTGIRSMLRSSDNGKTWSGSINSRILTGWYQGIGVVQKEAKSAGSGLTEEVVFIVGQSGEILRVN